MAADRRFREVMSGHEDVEDMMIAFVRANCPDNILRGYGCNFWGTGSDSQIQIWCPLAGVPA